MNFELVLGKTMNTGRAVRWTSSANCHLNISGQPGQRKTTLLRNLIAQVSQQNVHVVVIDGAGDFCDPEVTYPANWQLKNYRIIHVRSEYAPISAFTPWPLPSGGLESANEFADRIAGVLEKAMRLGRKQWGYLYEAIKDDFRDNSCSSMESLMARIEEDAFDYPEAESLRTRLAALNDFPVPYEDCFEHFSKPGVTIIDAQDLRSTTLRSLVTEILLANLWAHKLANKSACPLCCVCDECQNIRLDENSMAHTILREGRKYDVAMWASSQYIENPKALKVLSQASLQICFRPDDWSVDKTARRLTQSNPKQQIACKRELMRLQPGEFFFLHNGNPIRVDSNPEPEEIRPKPAPFMAGSYEK